MSKYPVNITPQIPIEWFLDTDMILHEAVNMDILHESYINRASFSSHIYNHTSLHISLMVQDSEKLQSKNTACLRVLLSSLVKREFEFWEENKLSDFKNKVHSQMKMMRDLEAQGSIDFENAPDNAIEKVQALNPNIREIGDKWHEVFEDAFTECNRIIEIKKTQQHDSGIWRIILDHAYRRN